MLGGRLRPEDEFVLGAVAPELAMQAVGRAGAVKFGPEGDGGAADNFGARGEFAYRHHLNAKLVGVALYYIARGVRNLPAKHRARRTGLQLNFFIAVIF